MSKVRSVPPGRSGRKKQPPRIIIARGEKIRSFTIRPWLGVSIGLLALAFLGLYLGATGYLFFRDDIVTGSISQQTRMRDAYADEISELPDDLGGVTPS